MASTQQRMLAVQYSKFEGGAAALEIGGSFVEYAVSPKLQQRDQKMYQHLMGPPSALRAKLLCKVCVILQELNLMIAAKTRTCSSQRLQFLHLAKLGGAHVTATCGARNADLVKSLGADEVLDYKTAEGAKLQSPSGRRYDVVIHCAESQPFSTFKPQLAKTARVIDLSPRAKAFLTSGVQLFTFASQRIVPFLVSANGNDLALLGNLVSGGFHVSTVKSRASLGEADRWVFYWKGPGYYRPSRVWDRYPLLCPIINDAFDKKKLSQIT